MTVTEALELARSQGVEVTLDGDDLVLKAEAAPPPGLLAILGRGKWDIVAALRLREAEERRRIVQWVNDHFASSPPGVCAHCGDGPRSEDPFVLLFVGNDRGEVHASCHSAWLAEREAEARRALGLEARPCTGVREALQAHMRTVRRWMPPPFRTSRSARRQRQWHRENWTYQSATRSMRRLNMVARCDRSYACHVYAGCDLAARPRSPMTPTSTVG